MVGRRALYVTSMIVILLVSAAAAADEKSAEKALQGKGLRRVGNHFALPDEVELAKLVRAAAAWLQAHRGLARRTRFDVIVCEPGSSGDTSRGWRLRHLEGAFDANG